MFNPFYVSWFRRNFRSTMSDDDTDVAVEDPDVAVENPDVSAYVDAGNQSPSDNTFDLTLATTHSYLGNDLEVLRGRTLLDNGIYLNLPLLFEKSVILFPEQTLPMVEFSEQIVNMLRSSVDKDRTFGVVCSGLEHDVPIGTTAEIYEYSDDPNGFRIKAKGRQRFKIIRVRRSLGRILADVKILPEIVLGPPFFEERLASLDRLRKIPKTESEAREQEYRVTRRDAAVTPWPSWVYRQYDSRRLAMRIHDSLQFVESRGSNIPEDPAELSFWVAHNLIMNDTAKIALLQYDCAISRLQYEAKVLAMLGGKAFVCSTCRALIGKHADIVPMNKEGLQVAYCNPAGAIHETVTLYRAENLILNREPPSTVCSWFPGYAWTIASCGGCGFHVGWLFTAVSEDLRPRKFWGLTRKSLILKRQYAATKNEAEGGGGDAPSSPSDERDGETFDSSESEDEQHLPDIRMRILTRFSYAFT